MDGEIRDIHEIKAVKDSYRARQKSRQQQQSLESFVQGESENLLISGDFRPGLGLRVLRAAVLAFGGLLALGLVVALISYALVVHHEARSNDIAHHTRLLNEENKELQVSLNRLQSYQNVQEAARRVPYLGISDQVIDVDARYQTRRFSRLPERREPLPRVFGY